MCPCLDRSLFIITYYFISTFEADYLIYLIIINYQLLLSTTDITHYYHYLHLPIASLYPFALVSPSYDIMYCLHPLLQPYDIMCGRFVLLLFRNHRLHHTLRNQSHLFVCLACPIYHIPMSCMFNNTIERHHYQSSIIMTHDNIIQPPHDMIYVLWRICALDHIMVIIHHYRYPFFSIIHL